MIRCGHKTMAVSGEGFVQCKRHAVILSNTSQRQDSNAAIIYKLSALSMTMVHRDTEARFNQLLCSLLNIGFSKSHDEFHFAVAAWYCLVWVPISC